ncbi:MAG: hypothetical protein JJU28_03095 [Cyclobacteriaceae bacterium]|nr:hypothetical protein [Cyclobacteriaceae bacterium]
MAGITWKEFSQLKLEHKIKILYEEGDFIVAIRYYQYKINLYQLGNHLVEVFYNHKYDRIEKIDLMADGHTRMKFYADQIRLPSDLYSQPRKNE